MIYRDYVAELCFIEIDNNDFIVPPVAILRVAGSSSETVFELEEMTDATNFAKRFGIKNDDLQKALDLLKVETARYENIHEPDPIPMHR